MSNISELANVPQISFIENMTLQETEEQLKAEYARIYREQTGKELVLGEADAKTLLLKAFALIEYQTMQYADIKGQAELLKTSTGEALDALVALLGLTRQESKKATAKERFLLAEARADTVAVPAGTRVKTQGGRYFNTLDYAEIPPGSGRPRDPRHYGGQRGLFDHRARPVLRGTGGNPSAEVHRNRDHGTGNRRAGRGR